MMRLLLLLVVTVAVGFSYDSDVLHYGDTYRIDLQDNAYKLEFSRGYTSRVTVLWKRGEYLAREDNRRKVIGSYFAISNVTQEDNGRYTVRSTQGSVMSRRRLEVEASIERYFHTTGDQLRISFNLEPNSCNIYFFPEGGSQTDLVSEGWLQEDYSDCTGFRLLKPCGISNDYLQASCHGRFEFRDHNENHALVVILDIESTVEPSSYLGIGGGILIAALCTCCLKCCCCKKKSSDKEGSEAAADGDNNENQPAYDQEPVGQRQNQPHVPFGTQYSAQPSFTPAAPLIHNPPTDRMPPAYSEFTVSSEPADAPTVPLYSDSEPRFEVKGMNFDSAAPLSSDSTHSDVYTSDKLNFL